MFRALVAVEFNTDAARHTDYTYIDDSAISAFAVTNVPWLLTLGITLKRSRPRLLQDIRAIMYCSNALWKKSECVMTFHNASQY